MPIKIDYVDGKRGVILTCTGVVTGAEVIDVNKEIYRRDETAAPLLYQLIETDGLTGVNISTRELHDIADQDVAASRTIPNSVIAIYVSQDLPYALARMWQVFVERSGWETNVFRERAEAEAWLKAEVAARFGFTATLE